jgi:hypothetical protein
METLVNKKIIYDDTCPMCQWYTGKFIESGVMTEGDRLSFSQLSQEYKIHLDLNRARHEIPLLDIQTGKVLYGLDGLMLIIGKVFPMFNKLLNTNACKLIIRPLYKFVSYNRRIVVPASGHKVGFDAAPDFHWGWRLFFMCFMLLMSLEIYRFHIVTLPQQLDIDNQYLTIGKAFLGVNLSTILLLSLKVKTFHKKMDCFATLIVAFFLSLVFGSLLSALIFNILQIKDAHFLLLVGIVFQVIFFKEAERRILMNQFLK